MNSPSIEDKDRNRVRRGLGHRQSEDGDVHRQWRWR